MWYAKHHSIVNEKQVEKLLGLVEMLKETKGMKIFRRGFEKAVEMLEKGEENGVFAVGSSTEELAKRPGLYILAGGGMVKNERGYRYCCGDGRR